jgi:PPOX class probable F420-dependent enzyme
MLSEPLKKTLDSPVFATVATIRRDGTPHLSVVWVTRDGDDVLFSILHGSFKEKHLLRDRRMTLLVCPTHNQYTYASITGSVSFTHEGKDAFMDRLSHKYTGMTYEEFFPDPPEDHDFVIVRLTPSRVYDILE